MNNYQNVGTGLRKMFTSLIGTLICGLLTAIPLVGIAFAIGTIVFGVIYIIGYYYAAKDIKACKVAFILVILNILLKAVGLFVEVPFADSLTALLPFAAFTLLIFSVSGVLRENGATGIANLGIVTWVVYLVGTIIIVGVEVILFIGMLADMIGIGVLLLSVLGTLLVSVVVLILQLVFYKKAAEQFGGYF